MKTRVVAMTGLALMAALTALPAAAAPGFNDGVHAPYSLEVRDGDRDEARDARKSDKRSKKQAEREKREEEEQGYGYGYERRNPRPPLPDPRFDRR